MQRIANVKIPYLVPQEPLYPFGFYYAPLGSNLFMLGNTQRSIPAILAIVDLSTSPPTLTSSTTVVTIGGPMAATSNFLAILTYLQWPITDPLLVTLYPLVA